MKSINQRLNNISGQIQGIKKMVDSQTDCVQVLTQLKAVKSAVSGVMDSIVENQFDKCTKSLKSQDKQLLIKIKKYVTTG